MGWNRYRTVAISAAASLVLACGRETPPARQQSAPPAADAHAGAPGDAGGAAARSAQAGGQAAPAQGATQADVPTLADFDARVKAYVALHRKLEETLPRLPKEATPQQIDQHQRDLGRLIQQARADAKPGSIFTPDIRAVVERLMAQVFGGPDGAALKASIMDENPGPIALTVNSRYPDTVPLSTVPPQVLQGLPTLPEELEFRFIGRHLILMDEHAHVIVDLIQNALPR